jgi:type VI secretion system protein ImpK
MMLPFQLGSREQIAADQFRRFYGSLLTIRDSIAPADPTTVTTVRPPGIDTLRTRLAREIAAFGYRHDLIGDAPVDAGYVLTAVADEVILFECANWLNYEAWADRPLEAVLYGTRIAGDRLFTAADELVARKRSDPGAATTILLALMIGFRGRYRGQYDPTRIELLKKDLYALVCRRDYRADDCAPYEMPALAATTLAGPSLRTLPVLWPWGVGLAALIVAYFPISHWLWSEQVRGIDALTGQILHDEPAPADRTL